MYYLDEIEEHLGCTIPQIPRDLTIPLNEFDGKVVYGEKRQARGPAFKGHVELLAPSVKELIELEKKTQLTFLNMKYNNTIEKLLK
jgi:ATP-dependent RNA helicase DDX1